MGLISEGKPYTSAELGEGGCSQRQLEISRQLTRLVDVLYALVLVQGAVYYRALFTKPDEFSHLSWWLPVALALALIYFTAIQSFIDYHFAAEDQPYQLLDTGKRRKDLWRFYLDVVIVGLYSFVLLKCHVLLNSPDADLAPVFWAFPAIFALYVVWGRLRRKTGPTPKAGENLPYSDGLLFACLVLYLALAVGYLFASGGWIANAAFLAAALLIMLFYRGMNWLQNRACGETAAAPAPAAAPAAPKDTAAAKPAS